MTTRCSLLAACSMLALAVGGHASDCSVTSVGMLPLPELAADTYLGTPGGLYLAGSNARPAAHDANLVRVGLPVPLDPAGSPDPVAGKIGLISCGMSNATQEFQAFLPLAASYPGKNPQLVIVDCALPGKTAAIIANPSDPYWSNCDAQIAAAGLTNEQVQVVWIKEADAGPSSGWPVYAETLRDEQRAILQILKGRYVNTRSAYLSSRIYAGYASSTLNPEPYAYESGFSVRWLIEEQLGGDPRLNFDPAGGPVVAPWIAWGPYLWGDGLVARRDGLTWECGDLTADGTHPSTAGRAKVARLLLDFFRSDPTTIPWFLACIGAAPGEVQDLKLTRRSTDAALTWTSLDPTAGTDTVYDIVSGSLAELRALKTYSTGSCHAVDVPDTPYPPADDLVLHLTLDDGSGSQATDSSAEANHGLVTAATWTAGRLAGGLQFDGSSSIVTVPSQPSISPDLALTVALWVQPDTLTDGVLASKWLSGSEETWLFRLRPDGTVRVDVSPTLTDGTYNYAAATVAPVVTAAAWRHLAFVYDGTQPTNATRLRIFVDGRSQAVSFGPGGIPTSLTVGAAPLSLGLGADGLRPYAGILDDARVYSRALTDSEIRALAVADAPANVWYRVRGRNSCAAGSWGDADLDGGAIRCP